MSGLHRQKRNILESANDSFRFLAYTCDKSHAEQNASMQRYIAEPLQRHSVALPLIVLGP